MSESMQPEIDPMDSEMRDLLRGSSDAYAPPPDAQARAFARLALAIPDLGGPSSGGGGGGGAPAGSSAHVARVSILSKMIVPVVVALGVGGAGGFAVSRATTPETVRIVYVDRAPTSATVAANASASVAAVATVAALATVASTTVLRPQDLPLAPPVAPRHLGVDPKGEAKGDPSAPESRTATERALLDGARAQLSQGKPADALAVLMDHARRYPDGVMREEREAMLVRALAQSGRMDEARMRAAAFKTRYPQSILLSAVESAVRVQ